MRKCVMEMKDSEERLRPNFFLNLKFNVKIISWFIYVYNLSQIIDFQICETMLSYSVYL